jgi:signal peptidase I
MQRNHLVVNDRPLQYRPVEDQERLRISRGALGASLELEQGNGPQLYVSYTAGLGPYDSFETVEVPMDMFFLMGSNRDRSADSRNHGLVHRSRILGMVIGGGSPAT